MMYNGKLISKLVFLGNGSLYHSLGQTRKLTTDSVPYKSEMLYSTGHESPMLCAVSLVNRPGACIIKLITAIIYVFL